MVPASKIRIKLTAFDHRVLMDSVDEIVKTAKRTGADVVGPVRLPTLIKKFTVNRSPHVDKNHANSLKFAIIKRLLILLIQPLRQWMH